MLEVEIKAYCDDLDGAERTVIALGGKKIRSRDEKDVYFNHPSRDFKITDEALRIRVAGNKKILTYKGPKIGEKSKTRFEHETSIEDAVAMTDILLRLGFTVVEEVLKERTIFILEDIEICLDRVAGLGDFIELEKKDNDQAMSEQALFALAEKLGLSRFERRSYLELKLGGV